MRSPEVAILTVLAIIVVAIGYWALARMAGAAIVRSLARVRATNIEMRLRWLDWDRDTLTWDVTYSTPDGRHHANRCKVAVGLFADRQAYWVRDLEGAA